MRHTAQNLCKHIYHTYHVTQNSTEEFSNDFIPTFRQFLQFVVDSGEDFDESKYVVVSHWKPYWLSCNPCHPGEDYFYCKERGSLLEFLFYANSRWAYNRNAMKQFCLLFKTWDSKALKGQNPCADWHFVLWTINPGWKVTTKKKALKKAPHLTLDLKTTLIIAPNCSLFFAATISNHIDHFHFWTQSLPMVNFLRFPKL